MSRIETRFADLRKQGRKALVPYIAAGDPEPGITVPLMHELVAAGADILELGVPFSDPMADGPVIQAACERALEHHVSLRKVLEMVREFRFRDEATPVVLMGYLNPIEVMGYEEFARAASEAGVDGVLTVDLPPEEAEDFLPVVKARGLDPIFLLSPTSSDERIKQIAAAGGGFLYYVSFKGVTGANALDVAEVSRKVENLRKHTDSPIGVGFGISDGETAARVATIADAVVVGSAVVKRIAANANDADKVLEIVPAFVREIREAMDRS